MAVSTPEPLILHAQGLTFDQDAGVLKPVVSAADSTDPAASAVLRPDEVVFVLHASPSAEPVVVGVVEDAEGQQPAPFQLVALQVPKPADVPPQLSGVPRVAQLPAHLARASPGDVVDYVVSTKAGTGRAAAFWAAVVQPLLRVAAQALSQDTAPDRVVVTESGDSVRDYARAEHAAAARTVVLISGDGGVVDLLNSSVPVDAENTPLPTIALVPLGTGNALFNSLHKPLPEGPSGVVTALRTLFNGVSAPLPTFKASFSPGSRIVKYTSKESASGTSTPDDAAEAAKQLYRQETEVSHLYGSIVASYGFHASIVYESDTPEYRAHGAARFSMVAQELLKESHEYTAEIDIGRPGGGDLERVPRDTHAYVLGTLVSNLERTFTISPASVPLDGKLRLVHFGPIGPQRAMDAMMKAYDGGKHVGIKWEDGAEIHYDDIEELRIRVEDEDERWRKVCIDGTIVDIPKGGTLSVQTQEKSHFNVVVDSSVL